MRTWGGNYRPPPDDYHVVGPTLSVSGALEYTVRRQEPLQAPDAHTPTNTGRSISR